MQAHSNSPEKKTAAIGRAGSFVPENAMPTALSKPPVFRFAPSPNGLLHLGHGYSALLNQALARDVGVAVYAEYGDAVAKPRLARKLRFGGRPTGSRTGFVGALKIVLPEGTVDGAHYYDKRYWQPERYWEWQDSIWKAPNTGSVAVRPLEVVPEADEPATPAEADRDDE